MLKRMDKVNQENFWLSLFLFCVENSLKELLAVG